MHYLFAELYQHSTLAELQAIYSLASPPAGARGFPTAAPVITAAPSCISTAASWWALLPAA